MRKSLVWKYRGRKRERERENSVFVSAPKRSCRSLLRRYFPARFVLNVLYWIYCIQQYRARIACLYLRERARMHGMQCIQEISACVSIQKSSYAFPKHTVFRKGPCVKTQRGKERERERERRASLYLRKRARGLCCADAFLNVSYWIYCIQQYTERIWGGYD